VSERKVINEIWKGKRAIKKLKEKNKKEKNT